MEVKTMASELKPSGYSAMPEAAETYEPAAWVRDRNLIKEPVKKAGLLEQLEQAASEIAELLASSLGPKGMNKLIINPVNETFLTSDGKVILKELDIPHPIVTSFKKLAESMDKGCGDGTKTAVLLASNLIINAIELRKQGVQPTTLLR
ncbi:MAG: TCP-1/cpn60 chaperonin family protein, partial [Methanosarcinaceae archaeon]|nr:TCP-1/cpn60 chaperonin family protein [Methanosarcinaceae archaeon]